MSARGSRSEKVKRIFRHFDLNGDGGLNREEMAALVVAVNPRVKFSHEQISVIIDEMFRTYSDFIHSDMGLTYDGLLRTYDDGTGDVDRDFEALGLLLVLGNNNNNHNAENEVEVEVEVEEDSELWVIDEKVKSPAPAPELLPEKILNLESHLKQIKRKGKNKRK